MFKITLNSVNLIKSHFSNNLGKTLNLIKVEAPLIVRPETGLNDNLNGIERPVSVGDDAQVVQSLAKWKRFALHKYDFKTGEGLWTDMRALRVDEIRGPLHSRFVQQFDWEKVINTSDRNMSYLQNTVRSIYSVLLETESYVENVLHIRSILPKSITFVTSQELEDAYPRLTPKERENMVCKEHGAVFVSGIGGVLKSGEVHDMRSSDYDSWIDGLNGDILVWNPILNQAFELSSMGIRVDSKALLTQMRLHNNMNRANLLFHRQVLDNVLPQTIGGGIGQDRLTMFLLRKHHIGEVHVGLWNRSGSDFL
jgi:aspartate--ammonia ligase